MLPDAIARDVAADVDVLPEFRQRGIARLGHGQQGTRLGIALAEMQEVGRQRARRIARLACTWPGARLAVGPVNRPLRASSRAWRASATLSRATVIAFMLIPLKLVWYGEHCTGTRRVRLITCCDRPRSEILIRVMPDGAALPRAQSVAPPRPRCGTWLSGLHPAGGIVQRRHLAVLHVQDPNSPCASSRRRITGAISAVPMPSSAMRTITLSAELPYMRGDSTPACNSICAARCGSVVEG